MFLLPTLVYENLYNQDGSFLPRARLERDIPTEIFRATIESVEHLKEGYLESFLESVNSIELTNKQGQKNKSQRTK